MVKHLPNTLKPWVPSLAEKNCEHLGSKSLSAVHFAFEYFSWQTEQCNETREFSAAREGVSSPPEGQLCIFYLTHPLCIIQR